MANRSFTVFVPLMVLFGGSAALPHNVPAKFGFEIQNPLMQTCSKNSGSSIAYKRITLALDEAKTCFSNYSTDAITLQQSHECPLREQYRTCLDPIIDPILSCLTGSRKHNRVFLNKVVDEVIQNKCRVAQTEESGEIEDNPNQCLRNKVTSIMNCDAPFFGKSIVLSDYDARNCERLSRSKSCIMDILGTCHAGDRVVAITDTLYNVANAVNNCNMDIGSGSIENEI